MFDFVQKPGVKEGLVQLMRDPIFEVRESALIAIKDISAAFDKIWVDSNVLSFIEPFLEEEDYCLRLNYFFCIQKISKTLSLELQKRIISRIKSSFSDPSANIRMAVVNTLTILVAQMKEKSQRVIIIHSGRYSIVDRSIFRYEQ